MNKLLLVISLFCFVLLACHEEDGALHSSLKIPSAGSEEITKVSYTLIKGLDSIRWEGNLSGGSVIKLDRFNLQGTTWRARVLIWIESGTNRQKVYRLQTEITFSGPVVELPPLDGGQWTPFEYVHRVSTYEWNYDIGIFSPWDKDPRKSFYVELEVKNGLCLESSVEKYYVSDQGNMVASARSTGNKNCSSVQAVTFPDVDEQGTVSNYLIQLRMILFLSKSHQQPNEMVTLLNFAWKVKDHSLQPGGGPIH